MNAYSFATDHDELFDDYDSDDAYDDSEDSEDLSERRARGRRVPRINPGRLSKPGGLVRPPAPTGTHVTRGEFNAGMARVDKKIELNSEAIKKVTAQANKITSDLGPKARSMSIVEIRKLCFEYAEKYTKIQSEQFQRLGILGEWNNPYLTMSREYEAETLEVFARFVEAGLVYKQLKPVHVARFPLGVKDLDKELAAARDAGANVVFSYTVGPENATIANGMRDLKWDAPQVGAWPLSFPFFIDGAKAAADGALMAQTFIAEPSNERRAAFLTAYQRKYKHKIAVPMAAAQSYDSTYLLTYALFSIRDGKFTGPAVKSALENIPRVYYGVVSTYEKPFSTDDKDAVTPNMLVMGKVKNGAVTFAYPEDARRNLVVQRKK